MPPACWARRWGQAPLSRDRRLRRAALLAGVAITTPAAATLPLASAARTLNPQPQPTWTAAAAAAASIDDLTPARVERFADKHGRTFAVGSDIAGIDLSRYARIVAATIHGDEIERVQVLVATDEQLVDLCGRGAAACYYGADDGSGWGQINVAASDRDIRHSLLHEYGHHLDNQLVGLGRGVRFGQLSCAVGADGSRRWLFARERQSQIVARRRVGCSASTPWRRLLPELFAEDYAYANGIREWELRLFAPPRRATLAALRADLARPFRPRTVVWRGRVAAGGALVRTLALTAPTFLRATAEARRGLRLALSLARRGRRVAGASGSGASERAAALVPAGRYQLSLRSLGGSSAFRVRIELR